MFFWKLLAVQFAFVLAFEYFVFTVCRLIDIFVADVPPKVEIKIRRERYLAKQALLDNSIFQERKPSTSKEEIVLGEDGDVEALEPTSEGVTKAVKFRDWKMRGRTKCSKSSWRRARLVESQSEFSISPSIFQKATKSTQLSWDAADKSTQTEEITLSWMEEDKMSENIDLMVKVERFRNINKKWTTFPFTSHDELLKSSKIPKVMSAIPSEDTLSTTSSNSDVFLSPPSSRTQSSFATETFHKMFFYNPLTSRSSSTSKSKPSSISSRTDSCDRESIIPRRKSLEGVSRRTTTTTTTTTVNRKPRPRSWFETSKSLAKVHLKANKFYL